MADFMETAILCYPLFSVGLTAESPCVHIGTQIRLLDYLIAFWQRASQFHG